MKKHLLILSALILSFALPSSNAQEEIEVELSLAEVPASFDVPSKANDLIERAADSGIDLLNFPKVVIKSGEEARFEHTQELKTKQGIGFTVGVRLLATPQVEGDTLSFAADFELIEFEGFRSGSSEESPILAVRQIKNITGSGVSGKEYLFLLMSRTVKQTVSEEGKADIVREIEKKMILLIQMKKAKQADETCDCLDLVDTDIRITP
jgi:hypothetical protein